MATSSGYSAANSASAAEHLGPSGWPGSGRTQDAGHRIVRLAGMEPLAVGLLQGEAFALFGDHVHHAGAVERLHEIEGAQHGVDVVPVDGPEVAESQLLEQHARRPEVLDALLDRLRELHHGLAADQVRRPLDEVLHVLAHPVGERARDRRAEVLVDGADVGGDRHAVVVEHHDDVALGMARVVHRLVGQSAGERTVSHHGHHVVGISLEVARRCHAVRRGERRSGMARAELIVLTLDASQEARQPTLLTQGGQAIVPTAQHLPGVPLVPHIPHDLVVG